MSIAALTSENIKAMPSGTQMVSRSIASGDIRVFSLWRGNQSDTFGGQVLSSGTRTTGDTESQGWFTADPLLITDLESFTADWEVMEVTAPTHFDYIKTAHQFAEYRRAHRYGCICEWEYTERRLPGNLVEPSERRPQAINDSCAIHGYTFTDLIEAVRDV